MLFQNGPTFNPTDILDLAHHSQLKKKKATKLNGSIQPEPDRLVRPTSLAQDVIIICKTNFNFLKREYNKIYHFTVHIIYKCIMFFYLFSKNVT